jgi:predicted neutral ceramidase superfamily lipid hydrolase
MKLEQNYTDKIIKIYTPEGYDAYKFDLFLKKLEEQRPFNISVIDSVPYGDSNISVEDVMSKDTMTFLVECVNANTEASDGDKDECKELLFKLYTKAQELK